MRLHAISNRPILLCVLCVLLLFLAACAPNADSSDANKVLILASTTSTQDSGLLDVLVPMFQEESGYLVQTVAVGTGAALRMAREGNADVLLVHAPEAEESLLQDGFGLDRRLVMHNDFVIVGPREDSAEIAAKSSAAAAFSAIAQSESPFVSRGDDSGTNKKELAIWSNTAFAPNDSKPSWYIESGQGMARTLFISSEKFAYALTDRATYLAQRKNIDLDILLEDDPILLNIYHVITVNPAKWPDVNHEAALAFADFITRDAAQAVIGEFGNAQYGQPLFVPDAGLSVEDLGLR